VTVAGKEYKEEYSYLPPSPATSGSSVLIKTLIPSGNNIIIAHNILRPLSMACTVLNSLQGILTAIPEVGSL
jgi:hypothetical protein